MNIGAPSESGNDKPGALEGGPKRTTHATDLSPGNVKDQILKGGAAKKKKAIKNIKKETPNVKKKNKKKKKKHKTLTSIPESRGSAFYVLRLDEEGQDRRAGVTCEGRTNERVKEKALNLIRAGRALGGLEKEGKSVAINMAIKDQKR